MTISYRTTVKGAEEKTRVKAAYKVGEEIKIEREFLGYGLLLECSREWLIFEEWPDFKIGDKVEVTIRKIED